MASKTYTLLGTTRNEIVVKDATVTLIDRAGIVVKLTFPGFTTAPAVHDTLTQAVSTAALYVTGISGNYVQGIQTVAPFDTTNAVTSNNSGATMAPASVIPTAVTTVATTGMTLSNVLPYTQQFVNDPKYQET